MIRFDCDYSEGACLEIWLWVGYPNIDIDLRIIELVKISNSMWWSVIGKIKYEYSCKKGHQTIKIILEDWGEKIW